jgi:hypothetical protein
MCFIEKIEIERAIRPIPSLISQLTSFIVTTPFNKDTCGKTGEKSSRYQKVSRVNVLEYIHQ